MIQRRCRSASRNAGPARSGFSIIELTVALTLVSIIAAMAIPRLNYERYRADAAMRSVKTVLQGAERNAIMRQTNIVVNFDEANRRMEILEDANNNCVLDGGERLTSRPLEDGARFGLPASPYPATAPSTAVSGPNLCTMNGYPAVQFLRDGAASTDADIYVTSSRGLPEDYRLVRVIQASGRAESYRSDGSSWTRYN
ncbi:MAG: hypothetical protein MNPFHGCM_01281 [Gemmatimonadaceae bacterium]|nr:hypothetical protein [Gemmatimonadaceae bacterium]